MLSDRALSARLGGTLVKEERRSWIGIAHVDIPMSWTMDESTWVGRENVTDKAIRKPRYLNN